MTSASPEFQLSDSRIDPKKTLWSDRCFIAVFAVIGLSYIGFILLLLLADVMATSPMEFVRTLSKPEIQQSIKLTLITCTISTILSVWVAVPVGYLLSRFQFPGKAIVDGILDIPIILPPLVVGLSLLILFQYAPFSWMADSIVYQVPAVVLAQFTVACAFAVRAMRANFEQMDRRREDVAQTLGANRFQAFMSVVLPESIGGIVTAATLAWARSMGEFGPLLIFAGTTRNKTEVLSTSVFLELTIGDLEAAIAVSLLMVFIAVLILIITRLLGQQKSEVVL